MIARTLLDSASCPLTQSFDAVRQLIAFYNHGQEPEEMPAFYKLSGEMVLVLSNKKDSYYVVTAKTCSCPAATYRPGSPCKHQRRYFPEPKKTHEQIEAESDTEIARLHKAKWAGGFNGPVDPDTIKAKTEAPRTTILANLIDAVAPTTTESEVRYWQKKQEA
jgi:hypothetical protein